MRRWSSWRAAIITQKYWSCKTCIIELEDRAFLRSLLYCTLCAVLHVEKLLLEDKVSLQGRDDSCINDKRAREAFAIFSNEEEIGSAKRRLEITIYRDSII